MAALRFTFPPLGPTGEGDVVPIPESGRMVWDGHDGYCVIRQHDRPACAYRCHYPGGGSPCDQQTAEAFIAWCEATPVDRRMAPRLAYGYSAGLPADTEVAWGCRAIVTQDGMVDVVWDRVDAIGPDGERQAFLERLRGIGTAPFDRAAELLRSREMLTREAREFVLYDGDGIVVKGNTNGSAGYLYVCGYPVS